MTNALRTLRFQLVAKAFINADTFIEILCWRQQKEKIVSVHFCGCIFPNKSKAKPIFFSKDKNSCGFTFYIISMQAKAVATNIC